MRAPNTADGSKLVIYLIITDIVKVGELLRTMYIDLRHLPASKSTCRLSLECKSTQEE